MDTIKFLETINDQIQSIFKKNCHDYKYIFDFGIDVSHSIQMWEKNIPDCEYKLLIRNSIEALEVSIMSLSYCIYMNAFSSLRLSLEMMMGAIYYSAHNLEFIEWTLNFRDLNWATINCPNNGVFSVRFCNAYFPELKDEVDRFHKKSMILYRELSEYVHGNQSTWHNENGLKVDNAIYEKYYNLLNEYNLYVFKNFWTIHGQT